MLELSVQAGSRDKTLLGRPLEGLDKLENDLSRRDGSGLQGPCLHCRQFRDVKSLTFSRAVWRQVQDEAALADPLQVEGGAQTSSLSM